MRKIIGIISEAGNLNMEVVELEDKLETYQNIVGGYIETLMIRKDILLVLNEEGKFEGLPPNMAIMKNGEVLDVIVGNVCFISFDKEGNFDSLNDEQIKWVKEKTKGVYTKNGIMAVLEVD